MNSCLAACIAISVYNAHDIIIRSDKRSHGRISWKNFEEWGFEITELRSSNGKTTGNRFDFEIAGILRLNQVRNIEGPLCSEIPCLVAPRVARCLCTSELFLCLSNDCDSSSIRAIFSHTNITGRAIPIYRSDYLPTITSPWVTQKLKFRNAESSQGHSRSHAVLRIHADWAKWLRLSRV